MKLKAAQLAAHLQRHGLVPLCYLMGDEPLQHREGADAIRAQASAAGYRERSVLSVEGRFDWNRLSLEAGNLSLFASRRLLDLRLGDKAPDKEGAAALLAYCQQPPPDTVLLISGGRLSSAAQKSRWVQLIEEKGLLVTVNDIELGQWPQWIEQRLHSRQMRATPEAIKVLAERAEGHLLAAAQEIEKLQLLFPNVTIDVPQVLEAVADSARFEVFGWLDAVLNGEVPRLVRQLARLRAEGVEGVLIASLLTREIRALCRLAQARELAQSLEPVFTRQGIWQNRKPLFKKALSRYSQGEWLQCLAQSVQLDRILKGAAPGRAWDALLNLGLRVAGVKKCQALWR